MDIETGSENAGSIKSGNPPEATSVQTVSIQVSPQIRQLNKYVKQAKHVAIRAINPVYQGPSYDGKQERRKLQGFNVQVEGTPQHLSYFNRLISDANLKIS